MVITVTLNPAMDKTMYLNNLFINKVNRAEKVRFDIGGKGINVSKVLKELGIDSVCTGFLGGTLEQEFKKQLDQKRISHEFVSIQDNTRVNIKIIDESGRTNTDINEPGPMIRDSELNNLFATFEKLCKKDDVIVLAGKVNDSLPIYIYEKLTLIAKGKSAYVVLDTEGEFLKEGIKAAPYAIKPNKEELQSLVGYELASKNDLVNAGKSIIQKGVEKVLISMGKDGCLLVTEKETLILEGFSVRVKSTVGAGDAMVAAMVYGMIHKKSNKEILSLAHACGTASVKLEGTEACKPQDIKPYYKKSLEQIKFL